MVSDERCVVARRDIQRGRNNLVAIGQAGCRLRRMTSTGCGYTACQRAVEERQILPVNVISPMAPPASSCWRTFSV